MVCKEEVFSWFQNLKGPKRIEVMCCFLNMCYPLELRFYGTCLEDICRKDFYIFKDEEIKANDLTNILNIRNIHDHNIRSKLIVVLSLLNSSNFICAKELFKVISEEIKIETLISLGVFCDFKLLDQYLLILTMAQRHPAFTFEQQTCLARLSLSFESYVCDKFSNTKKEETQQQSSVPNNVLPHGISEGETSSNFFPIYQNHASQCSESSQNYAQITNLKVKPSQKKMGLRIRVSWGNKVTDAFKTPHDIVVFHQKLIQSYPTEAKNINQDKCIPPLPHALATWNKQNCLNENIISVVTEYVQQLSTCLPGYVLESEVVRNFFMPSHVNRGAYSRNCKVADGTHLETQPKNSRLRSLTIYNSQISDNSTKNCSESKQKSVQASGSRKHYENGGNVYTRSSPITSPLESPLSSPYTSPLNSTANSRSSSPWLIAQSETLSPNSTHASTRLKSKEQSKQWNYGRNYKSEELQTVPIEEMKSLGISKDTAAKFNESEVKSLPNGLANCYLSKDGQLLKSTQSNSNNISPVCSEYSSPAQSPSPGEICNHSSSLNLGNGESIDRRTSLKVTSGMSKNDVSEISVQEPVLKRPEEDTFCMKGNINRSSISIIPFAVPYSSIITQMPPPQNVKPTYLPIPCQTNNLPQHINPGAIVFDNQFSRVPLPSALTFLPGLQRPHVGTPDRVLSSVSLPISTVSPFPVVTSGCTTVPSGTCSITTQRSNSAAVTNLGVSSSRYVTKNTGFFRDSDIQQQTVGDLHYPGGYFLNTSVPLTTVSCSCFTTNSARPSPAPSPSIMSPVTTPQTSAIPVSMSYLGMPYLFHSIPFLQAQAPANSFVPHSGLANSGQAFSYTLPNGITAISPELIYPGQAFTLQSPSSQSNQSPVTQCYGAFSSPTPVPMKLLSCYNCGKIGHRGAECKEQTMEDYSKIGKFQLNYNPVPKMPDSQE